MKGTNMPKQVEHDISEKSLQTSYGMLSQQIHI